MHGFVRLIPQDEIPTAGKFLILVGIVLPLLPDTPLLAISPVTPFRIWVALVVISGLSYLTYLVQRYRPTKAGALLPALLGGAYSSTVTRVVLAKRQKEATSRRPELSAGIIAATTIMYLRIAAVVVFFSPPLTMVLAPALVVLFIAGAAISWWEWKRVQPYSAGDLAIPAVNPLQPTTALIFATLFFSVSLLTAWVKSVFGETGIFALAALVGAADIDPFVLNLAQGGAPGMPPSAAAAAVLIAASANNLAKGAYAIGFGGFRAALRPASLLVALAVLGFTVAGVYLVLIGE